MKILGLTHRLPYAPNSADRLRAYHILRYLTRDAEVHLFSLADDEEAAQRLPMSEWLSSVTLTAPPALAKKVRSALALGGDRPLTHSLLDAPHLTDMLRGLAEQVRPDLLFAFGCGAAHFALDGPLQHIPCVFDMANVESARWATLSETTAPPLGWIYRREARALRSFEARAARHAVVTLVANEHARQTLTAIAPEARIEVVENGVDYEFYRAPAAARASQNVVFCGVLDEPPTVEGLRWFAREIWPAVRDAIPAARFRIIGAQPSEQVLKLGAKPGIDVLAPVHDIRPYLWDSAVSVAPLRTANGLQNEVLHALVAGLPVAITPAVAEGLPAAALDGCAITDDPAKFGEAVIEMLRESPQVRRNIAAAAHVDELTWERRLAPLFTLVSS